MAKFKISDLTTVSALTDAHLLEVCVPGTSNKATIIQLRNQFAAVRGDLALEDWNFYTLGAITTFNGGVGWGTDGVGSGATIISATAADGRTQNRLALNNGVYGRRMPWGPFWNRVKIVLGLRINRASNFTNTNGYIGICSGTANMVNVATCANFVGVRWGDGTGTSTFTAGTKINSFNVPNFRATTVRTGPVITDRGALSSGHFISANQGYVSLIIVEMSRPVFANDASSVNYSVAEASHNSTTVEFSHDKGQARVLSQCDVTPNLANSGTDSAIIGVAGVTAAPFAFDQSVGVLDTVNIYWPQAFDLEIAALAMAKIA
jgi:hypothetical protein